MRIISGKFRGKKIPVPVGLPVRPTTDFAKTGLFNILSARYNLSQLRVADLFSGTGSLTYEFLSRGCVEVTAVDRDPGCIRFIRRMLEDMKAPAGVTAQRSDALEWLKSTGDTFDLIVADPPFEHTPADEIIGLVLSRQMLRSGGLLVIEHASGNDLSALSGFREARRYGAVTFSFFGNLNGPKGLSPNFVDNPLN